MKTKTFIKIFTLSLLILTPLKALGLTEAEIDQLAEKITVRIIPQGSKGSGVIINKEGNIYTVLTANHVLTVNPGEEADVLVYNSNNNSYDTYYLDTKNIVRFKPIDLAIVQFKANKNYPVAKIGNSTKIKRTSPVYVAGFPLKVGDFQGNNFVFKEGKITGLPSQPDPEGYQIIYNNYTLPGMSGGPVLNQKGELIAIHGKGDIISEDDLEFTKENPNIATIKSGDNFAIPINTFLTLNKSDNQNTIETPSLDHPNYQKPPTNNLDITDINSPYSATIYNLNTSLTKNADDYFSEGIKSYKNGNYQEAINNFNRAINLDQNYIFAYNDRGNSYAQLKQYEQAINDYSQAINLDNNNIQSLTNRGIIYNKLGRYQEAINDFNRVLNINSKYIFAYNNRGISKASLNEFQAALRDFNQVINLDSTYILGYNNRGFLKYKMKDYEGAINDYNQAIELQPNYLLAYQNRGLAKRKLGDYLGAINDFNTAININPNIPKNYFFLGTVYHVQKQYNPALNSYQKALSLDNNYILPLINMGLIEYERGNVQKAIKNWENVLQIQDKLPEVYLALGVAYYTIGRQQEGLNAVQNALNLDSKYGNLDYLKSNFWGEKLLFDTRKLLP